MKKPKPDLVFKCESVIGEKRERCSCKQTLEVYDLKDGDLEIGGVFLPADSVGELWEYILEVMTIAQENKT